MGNINYKELKIEHIVVFNQEQTIFACTRENGSGRMRIFLAFANGEGTIYTRNGRAESWTRLNESDAGTVREYIRQATEYGVAVYQLNGSSHTEVTA